MTPAQKADAAVEALAREWRNSGEDPVELIHAFARFLEDVLGHMERNKH